MKKLIYIIAIICLMIILGLNIVFTTDIDMSEHLTVRFNKPLYLIGIIFASVLIFFVCKYINDHLDHENEEKKRFRNLLLVLAIVIYASITILWVVIVRPNIVADQIHTANLAQTMFRGDPNEFLNNRTYLGIPLKKYIAAYPQQITLAFIYSIFFRIIHFDEVPVLRGLNVIGAILMVIAIYKIMSQISKKYKTNKLLLSVLVLTYISIPMLTTFVYGDIPGLSLALWSVYFTMRLVDTKEIKYAIFSAICMSISYMMRMNSLIFIIATAIYLGLNLINKFKEKELKEKIIQVAIIVAFIVISIFPTTIVKNYYISKYGIEKGKDTPKANWIYIGMSEGPRANGWYNDKIGGYGATHAEKAKQEYPEKIKTRIKYFIQNPVYAIKFYGNKIATMWTENTHAATWYNSLKNNEFEKYRKPIEFYQKVLLIIICVCSLIFLIQNRKDLSLEVIFLITIFIGGFVFHLIWEAKSRYIIPYIVVLFPIASINLKKFKFNKNKE